MEDFVLVIPAAGKGERIKELSDYIPKPLLPLTHTTNVLKQLLDKFRHSCPAAYVGVRNEHHFKFEDTQSLYPGLSYFYKFSEDHEHSGYDDTVELLELANKSRNSPSNGYFVVSADAVVHSVDVERFVRRAKTYPEHPFVACYKTNNREHLLRSGNAFCEERTNGTTVIRGFVEKPTEIVASRVACSMYYIPKRFVINGCFVVLSGDEMGKIISVLISYDEYETYAYDLFHPWIDVTDYKSYARAIKLYNEELYGS